MAKKIPNPIGRRVRVVAFTCIDCGAHKIDIVGAMLPKPPRCAVCIHVPGWMCDPQLVRIFGRNPDRRAALEARYGDHHG